MSAPFTFGAASMTWYAYIKPPRSRADRVRAARNSTASGERTRKPPKLRDPKHVFYRTYSTSVYIGGYRAKVITRHGIAKLFDVPLSTVHGWDKAGVLPEPFMVQERGTSNVPVYLAAQIRCLMIVVRDLVKDGYVSIQWQGLPDHMAMLHAGYAEAQANFQKRLSGEKYGGEAGKYGVSFID